MHSDTHTHTLLCRHAHTHTHTCTYAHTCAHAHTHVHTHTLVHMHTHLCTHTHTHPVCVCRTTYNTHKHKTNTQTSPQRSPQRQKCFCVSLRRINRNSAVPWSLRPPPRSTRPEPKPRGLGRGQDPGWLPWVRTVAAVPAAVGAVRPPVLPTPERERELCFSRSPHQLFITLNHHTV